MFCYKCGKQIEDNSRFCPYCGCSLVGTIPSSENQSEDDKEQSNLNSTEQENPDKTVEIGGICIDESQLNKAMQAFNVGNKVEAIKIVKESTGLDLKSAKEIVDNNFVRHASNTSTASNTSFASNTSTASNTSFASNTSTASNTSSVSNTSTASNVNTINSKESTTPMCPKCNSTQVIPIMNTETEYKEQGYGLGKGCCGYILLGPIGILCGLCGRKTSMNTKSSMNWVCQSCGNVFKDEKTRRNEEIEEYLAYTLKFFMGSAGIYVAGHVLEEFGLELFGISPTIPIVLGIIGLIVSGLILVLYGYLGIELVYSDSPDEMKNKKYRDYSFSITAACVAGVIIGIISIVSDVSILWLPPWIYLVFGILGTIIFGLISVLFFFLSMSGKEYDAFEKKHPDLISKIEEFLRK